MLKEELAKRDRQIDEAREAAAAANARAAETSSKASEAVSTTAEVKAAAASLGSTVSDLKASSEANNSSVPSAAQYTEKGETKSPLSFKIGNADFTPGGFVDITSVNRSTNVGSGIGTSFGSIPFNNVTTGHLTESRLTAQNSRLSLKVNTKFGGPSSDKLDVTGYVETDFLGFQPPNANQTSNSNSLRLRLYFVDLKGSKWEIQAGQLWTWMTPNRVGLSPMPSDIFYSQNMDTNYQVGLTWARQTAFRVAYHPTSSWAIGISLENPQQFVPGSVTFPGTTAFPSTSFASQIDNGSGSTSATSSGTNPAVPNLHPDVIMKSAWDAKVGDRNMHFEVAGLVRSFKVYNGIAGTTNSITGGGGSANVNLELVKNFHLIGNSFYSYGGGRYIFGLGPDVIVRPDGTLSGVHSGSGIGGFEWQANPRTMFYGYYGGAYYQRNFGLLASSATPAPSCNGVSGFTCVGFGFPGSSNSANRAIQEGTFGIIPTLYSNPNRGRLQIITQYSYLVRSPWFVASGTPKNAHTSLIYADVRYTLP